MEKRDDDGGEGQNRMPFEWDDADVVEIQITDRGSEKHKAQSKNASVHDQGKAQDLGEGKSVDHVIQRLSCLAWTGGWRRNRGKRPQCQK